jgi:hypothetical protein
MLYSALVEHPHEFGAQLRRELLFQRRPVRDQFDGHGDTPVGLRSRIEREFSAAKGRSWPIVVGNAQDVVVRSPQRSGAWQESADIPRAGDERDIPQIVGSGHLDIPQESHGDLSTEA